MNLSYLERETALILVQPVTGFQVVSVHSIVLFSAMG